MGCDLAQGFEIGRATSPDKIAQLLRATSSGDSPRGRSGPPHRANFCPHRADPLRCWRRVDPTDRTIVMALQQDARISFRDLAARA